MPQKLAPGALLSNQLKRRPRRKEYLTTSDPSAARAERVNGALTRKLHPNALYKDGDYDLYHPPERDWTPRESFSTQWERICKGQMPADRYERGLAMCQELDEQVDTCRHNSGLAVIREIRKNK